MHGGGGQQSAGADDHEIVGEQCEFGDEVAGDEHRPASFGVSPQIGAKPANTVGVESVGGFVEQQRLGFTEQGAGEGESLAHAEREAADPLVGHGRDADLGEDLVDSR